MSVFKIIRDAVTYSELIGESVGPNVGLWIIEDENGEIIEGPFDTKRDAEEYLKSRENSRQFYAEK
jgi:hypothetical protein